MSIFDAIADIIYNHQHKGVRPSREAYSKHNTRNYDPNGAKHADPNQPIVLIEGNTEEERRKEYRRIYHQDPPKTWDDPIKPCHVEPGYPIGFDEINQAASEKADKTRGTQIEIPTKSTVPARGKR